LQLKFVEHLKQAVQFDATVPVHRKWMSKAEINLSKFANVNKLLDSAIAQQNDFKVCMTSIYT